MFGVHLSTSLYLNTSPARREFKDLLGNANDLLVTILVGLSAVEQRLITQAPSELHAAWNPRDTTASAWRSRIFVLGATLARSVDALDTYISWLRRKPVLIQDAAIRGALDGAGQSVGEKFQVIRASVHGLDPLTVALVEIMLAWRNRTIHSLADNEASGEAWNILKTNANELKDRFNGLTLERMERGFEHNDPPSFKETASFIRATHEAVREIDEHFIRMLSPELFIKELIWHKTGLNQKGEKDSENRHDRIQNIWGRDASDRMKRVSSFLINNGLSVDKGDPSAEFDQQLLIQISSCSTKEIIL